MQRINAIETDIALSVWVSQDNFSMRNSEVDEQLKEFAGCFHVSCSSGGSRPKLKGGQLGEGAP